MSFSLLSLSSMYSGYLESFYNKHRDLEALSYKEHYNLLLEETTEFAGSYIRNFRKLGIDASCIIANDNRLQKKWLNDNGFSFDKTEDILFARIKSYKPDILWIEDVN